VVLLLAIVATSVRAASLRPEPAACGHRQHACCTGQVLVSCCDRHDDASGNSGGPVQSRTQLQPAAAGASAVLPVIHLALAPDGASRIQAAPPRGAPVALPILFASLLI
jgi:hypothetical protein